MLNLILPIHIADQLVCYDATSNLQAVKSGDGWILYIYVYIISISWGLPSFMPKMEHTTNWVKIYYSKNQFPFLSSFSCRENE